MEGLPGLLRTGHPDSQRVGSGFIRPYIVLTATSVGGSSFLIAAGRPTNDGSPTLRDAKAVPSRNSNMSFAVTGELLTELILDTSRPAGSSHRGTDHTERASAKPRNGSFCVPRSETAPDNPPSVPILQASAVHSVASRPVVPHVNEEKIITDLHGSPGCPPSSNAAAHPSNRVEVDTWRSINRSINPSIVTVIVGNARNTSLCKLKFAAGTNAYAAAHPSAKVAFRGKKGDEMTFFQYPSESEGPPCFELTRRMIPSSRLDQRPLSHCGRLIIHSTGPVPRGGGSSCLGIRQRVPDLCLSAQSIVGSSAQPTAVPRLLRGPKVPNRPGTEEKYWFKHICVL
ncbi:hypothetical protein BDK51DRAFT_39949 [Blyttiomyces helicus]|uniref:Uncharacterized protein n=1 Tax=Blyttiomyces helicus TaxID=388810 RepID=A0A4P9WKZ7_9FUNG|nr:hypothetical protein BDK51DRAFT_39949 [Blyttiomyces helicus]|eukprot:RKO92258.1 hypothetical protein BDK51DRAFT_39949 [Blyttiomyces helicus]